MRPAVPVRDAASTGGLVILTIGVDPGPTPGVCVLPASAAEPVAVFQCDAASLLPLLRALIEAWGADRVVVAVEAWVVGSISRTSRSAGAVTRGLIGEVEALADEFTHVAVVVRRATDVKPWATDRRLDAAGLLARTAGLPHARDGARHALFSASRDSGAPDPLLK